VVSKGRTSQVEHGQEDQERIIETVVKLASAQPCSERHIRIVEGNLTAHMRDEMKTEVHLLAAQKRERLESVDPVTR
jgi:hypothetical protein